MPDDIQQRLNRKLGETDIMMIAGEPKEPMNKEDLRIYASSEHEEEVQSYMRSEKVGIEFEWEKILDLV